MNILVTGANGQLGNEIRLASAASSSVKPASPSVIAGSSSVMPDLIGHLPAPHFIFTDVVDASPESLAMLQRLGGAAVDTSTRRLDITDLDAIRALVREEQIGAVVNCAAFTNVDAAEEKGELAELLNAKAPENLALAMKEVNGLLVHISTDYVFGADPYNKPCREDQTGTPTGVYGLTKLHGEQAIRRVGCEHVIIRTAWLYSEFGKNFVRTMLNLTATRPQLKVVFDQTGTPTYAADLASAILTILQDYSASCHSEASSCQSEDSSCHSERSEESYPHSGTYHFSNEGVCSWFDFTKMIAQMADELTGLSPAGQSDAPSCHARPDRASATDTAPVRRSACDIQPCHSDEFPSPVKRPAYSVLDKTKIKATFGLSIPYWTDSLRRCLASLV